MCIVRWIVLGLWLLPTALIAGPVVNILAVDQIAYEHANVPARGIETLQTPSRKAAFQVWRSGLDWFPLVVRYSIGGTASNGVDYDRLSGQVTIPAGARFARIVVRPIDDQVRGEGQENVVLTLRPSSGYRPGISRQARIEIWDDDIVAVPGPPVPPVLIGRPIVGVLIMDEVLRPIQYPRDPWIEMIHNQFPDLAPRRPPRPERDLSPSAPASQH